MPERDLTIRIKGDNSDIKRDAAEAASSLAKIETAAKAAGVAHERAFGRARDEFGRFKKAGSEAADGISESLDRSSELGGKLADTIAGVGAQFLTLAAPAAIFGYIKGEMDGFHKTMLESTGVLKQYRESIAELAALKGQLGQSTTATREDISFRSKTLQTQQESNAFQQAALGVGESAIGTLISKDEFTKAMELAGSFQAAEGGSAATHGQLIGQIPMLLGKKTTGEQAFREEQALYNIFKPGGADFSSLSNQFLKSASPAITSGLIDDRKAAALVSAFSVANKEGAGENFTQFMRGTVGALGKGRKVKGLEGAFSETQAQYLQSLGANDQMDAIGIGNLISGDLSKQEAASAAQGQQFNPMTHLQARGYGNMEDVNALLNYHGMKKSGTFDAKFMALAGQTPTLDEAKAGVDRFQKFDPRARDRRNTLTGEASQVALAVGPIEQYNQLLKAQFDLDVAKGTAHGDFTSWRDSWDPRKGAKLEGEVSEALGNEETKLGLPIPRSNHFGSSFQDRAQLAQQRAARIQEKGGDPTAAITQKLIELTEKSLRTQERMEQHLSKASGIGQPGGKPPLNPPKPNGQPRR